MSVEAWGPQHPRDDRLTARMRAHQSWWRHERLGVGWGTNQRGVKYGNYFTEADAERGLNFLTPAIRRYAVARMQSGAGVEPFRCMRNLLSSQPMAFNLFGPLHDDPDLAVMLLDPLLPGGVTEAQVDVEWAPDRRVHLQDATSFDVVARYTTRDGRRAIAGIETKLTEPFSQRTYGVDDHHAERYRAVASASTVWIDPSASTLPDMRWNQIWRNHLLVESIRHHDPGLLGCQVVVHHPDDTRCTAAISGYVEHLTDANESFRAFTLSDIVDAWSPLVSGDDEQWLVDFTDRYLDLHLSGH